MHDATETTGTELDLFLATALLFRGRSEGTLRHVAVHDTEIDAGLFPDLAVGENHTGTTSASVANPSVLPKGGSTVNGGNLTRNVELGLTQHFFHLNQQIFVVAVEVGYKFGKAKTLRLLWQEKIEKTDKLSQKGQTGDKGLDSPHDTYLGGRRLCFLGRSCRAAHKGFGRKAGRHGSWRKGLHLVDGNQEKKRKAELHAVDAELLFLLAANKRL